ncbi:response regulator transcription factor [Oleiharenicola lentus]|uniref:response regulator transcription factor n=1 Tax=Oleiharenicola lentus TaxID=2508720 RepID=UPI003F672105
MPPSPRRLLLIDDDRTLCALIGDYLRPHGFEVSACHHGETGAGRATAETWDAVLLDVSLPGLGGYEVLKKIRATSPVPVVMLTARNDESDRIAALDHGADDFVPKIFSQRELRARLEAVLRRSRPSHAETAALKPAHAAPLISGDLRIDLAGHRVTHAGQPLELTAAEFAVLVSLIKSTGTVLTRAELVERARSREFELFDRSIDVHIFALRKKLGDAAENPRYIRTVRGAGYEWVGEKSGALC